MSERRQEARPLGDASASALRRALTWLGLLAIGALAFAIRSRFFGFVFTDAGEVMERTTGKNGTSASTRPSR